MSIPRKIHYVWIGDQPLPSKDQFYIEGWKKLNPDFKIIRWSEKDVDTSKYPIINSAIQQKRYALASDVLRMIIIYQEGGIYLDTDIELLKSLEPLLKYDAFAGWEAKYWFTTAIFGARKHSSWMEKILKRYESVNPNERITTNTFLKTVHSPSVYAEDIYNIKLNGETQICDDDQFAVFAPEYFCPKHYMTGEENITKNTIALHHYASTWHTRSEKVKNTLSRTAYKCLGEKGYQRTEKIFHDHLAKQIRRELP